MAGNHELRVIFGLGNPGAEYDDTPHNIGAASVRAWAARAKLEFAPGPGPFVWTPVRRGVRAVIPTTYMNVCGDAVTALARTLELGVAEILVVSDDVWLPLGRLRLRTSGSDGGHNGLKSVAEALGSEAYARLRIGVGPVPEGDDWAEFVLRKFAGAAQATADETVTKAVEALDLIVARGYRDAQNVVNAADESNGDTKTTRNDSKEP